MLATFCAEWKDAIYNDVTHCWPRRWILVLEITLVNCASNQHKINDTWKWKSCDNNENSKSSQFCICSCDIFPTFEFVDEIRKYYCSVESNWVVPSRADICFSSFCKFNFWKLVKVLKLRVKASFVRSLIVNGACEN